MARRRTCLLSAPDRRTILKAGVCTALGASLHDWAAGAWSLAGAEEQTLYNGIRLPTPWPPRSAGFTDEPMMPLYLTTPPDTIPIGVGRQLFVDDFLIEKTTLRRTFHATTYHPATPILKPEKPWEQDGGPTAMVFSDGV